MTDNKYTRNEVVCPMSGKYCNSENKDCNECIADEEKYQMMQNSQLR